MKKIIIIGAGAMGSAFTVPCIDNNNEVTLVGTHLENELVTSIKKNKNFHPSLKTNLASKLNIERFENLKTIMGKGADVIVAAISSVGIKWFAEEISKYYKKKLPIILLTKGLSVEKDELITLSEKIRI
jgi:glycerol-3-phosphate dehydrogenase (NAD(P)+)